MRRIYKYYWRIIILKFPLTGVGKQKLSQFRKSFVSQVFQQNSEVIEQKLKALPRGVILGDETKDRIREIWSDFNQNLQFIEKKVLKEEIVLPRVMRRTPLG